MPARHKTGKNVGKTKKGHQKLAGRKRKGTSGNAANFMTRQQAIKKLQITLPEFRKLCILHGVYPREPRKSPKGKDKTYFYAKDILHLAHDPLLQQFRAYDAWKQKITKAQHKKESRKVESLVANKPKYKLDHVVLQRYPTFESALEDLDDALCMISLFSVIAQNKKVRPRRVENCARLLREWESFVASTHALRKTFVSIKGIYYQAEVGGREVTWMTPLQFTYPVPKDVDLRVMLAFLEFYESLVSFVLYKLYHDAELPYPPPHLPVGNVYPCLNTFEEVQLAATSSASSAAAAKAGRKQVDGKTIASLNSKLQDIVRADEQARRNDRDGEDGEGEANGNGARDADMGDAEEERIIGDERQDDRATLFSKCKFKLSREVPTRSLELCIKACGGGVTWVCDEDGDAQRRMLPFPDAECTHEVVDRPRPCSVVAGREYVQPQWVYDSINCGVLLPADEYAVGATLPPHLSPFVNDQLEGYVPEQRKHLDDMIEKAKTARGIIGASSRTEEEQEEDLQELRSAGFVADEEDREKKFQQELELEARGVMYSRGQGDRDDDDDDSSEEEEEEEEKEEIEQEEIEAEETMTPEQEDKKLAAIMIPSKKKRRLYQRIQYSQEQKRRKTMTLEKKRDDIKKAKKSGAK